eukprot:m.337543 g.337543  ORF g.337543 m.337543 type:complete len:191 (-) comp18159_c0_seq1:28-600(-)
MPGEIASWLSSVGNEHDVDVSSYTEVLEENGITLKLIPQVSEIEWKEMIKEVGPRTILRKAASEMMAPVDVTDFMQKVQAAREERENMDAQTQQAQDMNTRYKEQLDRVQQMVTQKMGLILQRSNERDQADFNSTNIASQNNSLKSEVSMLKSEMSTLESELKDAEKERDAAVKQAQALSSYASAIPGGR